MGDRNPRSQSIQQTLTPLSFGSITSRTIRCTSPVESFLAIGGNVSGKLVFGETATDEVGDPRFVFDHQDTHTTDYTRRT